MGDLWYFIRRKGEMQKIKSIENNIYGKIDNKGIELMFVGNELPSKEISKKFGEDYIHNPEYNKFINEILF